MKTIRCKCGADIKVDDADYEPVKNQRWFHGDGCLFNDTNCGIGNFVWGKEVPNGFVVDHIDRDVHNNQMINLRLATRSQNCMNQGIRSTNSSAYKGVCWSSKSQKWCATITVNYKQKWLGSFNSPEEAARVYNEAAKNLHGEFAFQNVIH